MGALPQNYKTIGLQEATRQPTTCSSALRTRLFLFFGSAALERRPYVDYAERGTFVAATLRCDSAKWQQHFVREFIELCARETLKTRSLPADPICCAVYVYVCSKRKKNYTHSPKALDG